MVNLDKSTRFEAFMLVWGVFSAMPIISVMHITVFVLMQFIFMTVIVFYKPLSISAASNRIPEFSYSLFTVVFMISTFLSLILMPPIWLDGWGNRLIQGITCIAFYFYFVNEKNNKGLIAFVYGVYISAVVQLVWGYLQLVLYNWGGIDLNKLVFQNLLHMLSEDRYASHIAGESLKASGLCWNAGNYAPLILFGLVYSKNNYLKLAFIVMSLISGSRTLLLGVIAYYVVLFFKKIKIENRVNKKIVIIMIFAATTCVSLVIIDGQKVFSYFEKTILVFQSMIDFDGNGSSQTHLRYFTEIPAIFKHNSFIHNLIGYGHGCSGYAYPTFPNSVDGTRWTVECDIVNYLWSYGIIGFLSYYCWQLKNISRISKQNDSAFSLFIALIIEGIGYNITWDWMKLLMISIFILYRGKIDVFHSHSYSKSNNIQIIIWHDKID